MAKRLKQAAAEAAEDRGNAPTIEPKKRGRPPKPVVVASNVTDETNRGTVSGVTEMFPLLATVVTTLISGILIERVGYTWF